MSIFQAIILGIVQGLTEFFPVSSSGHFAVIRGLFGIDTDMGLLFDVLLHVATLVAIMLNGRLRHDIIKIFMAFCQIVVEACINLGRFFTNIFSKQKKEYIPVARTAYRKFALLLFVSTIPTGVLGFLMRDMVGYVATTLLVPGISLIITGVFLFMSDMLPEGMKKPKDAEYLDAFSIGCVQGVATIPGLSRSGATIVAALLCGFEREFAVRYSFIMSVPAILGALVLELTDIGSISVSGSEVAGCILGMIFAAVIGFFAIHFATKLVVKRYFKYFGFYCFAVGAIAIVAFLIML